MLRSILVLAVAIAAPAFAANELDQDAAMSNRQAPKGLPAAFIVRTAKDGSVAVAEVKEANAEKLTSEQIAKLNFVNVEADKKYTSQQLALSGAKELDQAGVSESWVAWGWGGYRWGWGGGWSYPSYWGAYYGAAYYPYAASYYYPAYYGYGYAYYRPCW